MQQRRLRLARFQVVARVAFHEVGPAGCLGLVPLANHLQEAAAEHARHLGVSISRLGPTSSPRRLITRCRSRSRCRTYILAEAAHHKVSVKVPVQEDRSINTPGWVPSAGGSSPKSSSA
jgi:hypothetical protein